MSASGALLWDAAGVPVCTQAEKQYGPAVVTTAEGGLLVTWLDWRENPSSSYAALYVEAGRAARRVESPEALEFVSKVFWFSLEFGVVREADGPKAYGAGLLSSYGEIQEFPEADLRPLDLARMGTQTYDITHYQPVLFAARSWDEVHDVVGGFFATADDESIARLQHESAAAV